MYHHHLRLRHQRDPFALHLGEDPAESNVEVHTNSADLTEAWRELLSRLPNDVYQALKDAMEPTREEYVRRLEAVAEAARRVDEVTDVSSGDLVAALDRLDLLTEERL